ncbi:hypothetical protein [Pantoea agglomerans]|uniref:Uncharacterized protein n=1 Tax=Enterobacter agglomerans TaxID=549 RepID=A0ACC5RRU1_ENTAG|nr:hypothetical protein [Pantoea agglomerans]MBK4727202.1 hypothetical protein [Pantoea agglomerans]
MKTVEISNAAFVFTDSGTGQGYIRRLNEFEVKLISQQLTALDDGEMKALAVHPVEIRVMTASEAEREALNG